jgi:hypothetical protein
MASSENYLIHITEHTVVFHAVCTLHECAYCSCCICTPSSHICLYVDMKTYVCFTVSPVEKVYELMTKPYILTYIYWHVTKKSDFESEAL